MRARPLLALSALSACVGLAGCPNELTEVCGLAPELPEVAAGRGQAELDGAPFDQPASWAPGSSASVTIGLLDLVIPRDETGLDFDQLLEDAALPFCARLGEQSATVGKAILNGSPTFVSDSTHTGGVAILARDGDLLVGRFEAELVSPNGDETRTFENGVFQATRR
jgi:hypothetical protein